MRGLVLCVILIFSISAVYGVSEEFEKEYTVIGSNYGKVKIAYLDSNADRKYDSLAMVGNDGTELRFIKFAEQPAVVWTQKLDRANSFALASVDLEGKGYRNYIVVGTKEVIAYDFAGSEVWRYPSNSTVYSITPVDLNGDGYENEVVVGLWGKVVALDSKGEEIWSYTINGRGDKIVALDTNGDGVKDSIAVALRNRIEVLNPLGNVRATVSASHFSKDIATVGVVGTEKGSRIVVLDVGGKLQCFSIEGEKLWESSVYLDNPEIAKIIPLSNGEGINEQIAVFTGFIYVYDSEGNRQWVYSQTIFNDVSPADVDGDGRGDFLGCTNSKIYAIVNGQQVGYYLEDSNKISPYNRTGAKFIASIDIDGDGALDDVLGVTDTDIFVLSHKEKERARQRVVIVANSIDYRLATDFFDWLREAGFEPLHVFPDQFESYRKEKLIVILGGHKAPEGTGDIVRDLLTTEEKEELERKGAIRSFELSDVYTVGQRIYIFAGNTREETKAAHRKFRTKLL